MEELLTCPQCKSAYNDPRLLPCDHTLCFACVEQLQNSKQPKDRICPVDKTAFPVNLKAKDLPQNLLCAALATLLPKKTSTTSGSVTCPNCSGNATLWCEICGDLCENCSKTVHSVFKTHKPISLQEKKHATIIPKCSTHDNKEADLYCPQCKILLCHFCEKASHPTHKCTPVLEAAKSTKETLKSNLTPFVKRKDVLQKVITKKREEVKTSEADIEKTRKEIEERKKHIKKVQVEIEEKNKKIESHIQQFNQSENIYNTLVKVINDQNNIDILNSTVFEETKSLVGSVYKAVYQEEIAFKIFPTFDTGSKTQHLILNNNTVLTNNFQHGGILGSVTSAQSFVWKFKINQFSSCYIGLVPPSKFADMRSNGHVCLSGVVGFYNNCYEIPNAQSRFHSNCPDWKVNDIIGLELDNGTLRFYHNDDVVKEMPFTHLDYVPGVSVYNSSLTLITE